MTLGRDALMAKVDIEVAYRLIAVQGCDCLLLGLPWEDSLFVDPVLRFGLCSAPKIFNAVTDALQWDKEG